jgi:hypothetical protein
MILSEKSATFRDHAPSAKPGRGPLAIITRTAGPALLHLRNKIHATGLALQDLRAEAEQLMLNAITPAQVEQVISLLEQLAEARKTRATEGKTQTPYEIMNDPERRQLTDYLYALSDDARKELIALMLLGRGDFDHSYQNALETCSRYTSADDQVVYLMGKTVRLAEYLSIGLGAISRIPETKER